MPKRKCAPVSRQIFLVPTRPGDNKGPESFPRINLCQAASQSHDRDVWRNILQEVKPEVGLMCVQGFGDEEPARAASIQMGLAGAAETDEGDGMLVLATGFPFSLACLQPGSIVYGFARLSNHTIDKRHHRSPVPLAHLRAFHLYNAIISF